jgi:hypothetical protein
LVVPIALNVKAGPFWAMVSIAGSLLLLFFARRNKKYAAHLAVLDDAAALSERAVLELTDQADEALIGRQIRAVREKVENQDPEGAKIDLDAIKHRLDALVSAQDRYSNLDKELRRRADPIYRELRHAVADQSDQNILNEILGRLTSIGPQHLDAVLRQVSSERFRRWRVKAMLYVVPRLLYLAAAIALVFLGLKELYLDNQTFGARPLLDYGSLAIWGVASEAVADKVKVLLPRGTT